MVTYQQKSSHFFQCPSAAADRLEDSHSLILYSAARKLSHKQYCLEGSTTSMAGIVYVKRPYPQAECHLLYLLSKMAREICCCLPCSNICGRVHNGGTVGEWIGCVGGGLVEMLM